MGGLGYLTWICIPLLVSRPKRPASNGNSAICMKTDFLSCRGTTVAILGMKWILFFSLGIGLWVGVPHPQGETSRAGSACHDVCEIVSMPWLPATSGDPERSPLSEQKKADLALTRSAKNPVPGPCFLPSSSPARQSPLGVGARAGLTCRNAIHPQPLPTNLEKRDSPLSPSERSLGERGLSLFSSEGVWRG